MEAWKREAMKARDAAALDTACPDCKAVVGEKCVTWGISGRVPARRICFRRVQASNAAIQAVQDVLAKYRENPR